MAALTNIIKVNQTDYNTLAGGGTITKDGITYSYDSNALYLVEGEQDTDLTLLASNTSPLATSNITLTLNQSMNNFKYLVIKYKSYNDYHTDQYKIIENENYGTSTPVPSGETIVFLSDYSWFNGGTSRYHFSRYIVSNGTTNQIIVMPASRWNSYSNTTDTANTYLNVKAIYGTNKLLSTIISPHLYEHHITLSYNPSNFIGTAYAVLYSSTIGVQCTTLAALKSILVASHLTPYCYYPISGSGVFDDVSGKPKYKSDYMSYSSYNNTITLYFWYPGATSHSTSLVLDNLSSSQLTISDYVVQIY